MARITEFYVRGVQAGKETIDQFYLSDQKIKEAQEAKREAIPDADVDVLNLPPTEEELLSMGIDLKADQFQQYSKAMEAMRDDEVLRTRLVDGMAVADQLSQGVANGEFDLETAEKNLLEYTRTGGV